MRTDYDIIVIGGGHAGCEAAMAASRMGSSVLLISMDMNKFGQMSCNPAIGGIAKGQIVREIDALGGYMGIVTDASTLQFRMLNRSKGPAMWSPRAQCDKNLYSRIWRKLLETNCKLDIYQDTAVDFLFRGSKISGCRTKTGAIFNSQAVILTAGTFLDGKLFIGRTEFEGGRIGEMSSYGLTSQLADMGLAALQSGCGLCTVAAPEFLIPALSAAVVENTLFPLDDDGRGICYNKEQIDELARMMKCVAIGPGIGGGYKEISRVIADLASRNIKLIIDADGLNCLANDISVLDNHTADILLTPHPMEMARLNKLTLDQVLEAPLAVAENFAKKYGVTVLLKGSATIITDGEKAYVMKDGGPYLAKGGSGDVLTGVITGIAARGYSLAESAAVGSYLCAMAGKRVSSRIGEYGTLPSQVAREIKRITDEFGV